MLIGGCERGETKSSIWLIYFTHTDSKPLRVSLSWDRGNKGGFRAVSFIACAVACIDVRRIHFANLPVYSAGNKSDCVSLTPASKSTVFLVLSAFAVIIFFYEIVMVLTTLRYIHYTASAANTHFIPCRLSLLN